MKGLTVNEAINEAHAAGGDPEMAVLMEENSAVRLTHTRRYLFASFILLIGCGAGVAFFVTGIISAKDEQHDLFMRHAIDLEKLIVGAWKEYESSGLWMHESCREKPIRNNTICSRQEFSELARYMNSKKIGYQALEFMRNVSHGEREEYEAQTRAFHKARNPELNCSGISGFVRQPNGSLAFSCDYPPAPFYFPVQYLEPLRGNEQALDFDLYSSPSRAAAIDRAVTTWKPTITARIRLVQETADAYSILLFHPGINLDVTSPSENTTQRRGTSLALIVIRIPDLLERALARTRKDQSIYLYDSTSGEPVFMGARSHDQPHNSLPEIDYLTLKPNRRPRSLSAEFNMEIANRRWTLVVLPSGNSYDPNLVFVILGGSVILTATFLLVFVFCRNMRRVASDVHVETARRNAAAERALNEYIAHEVRNPLSSAVAALSFARAANKEEPTPELRNAIENDLVMVDSSLSYMNDLLRNMLDWQRASNKMMRINLEPTDIRVDVFEPVRSILYQRSRERVEFRVDCPTNLVVLSDVLRLKQICLNLASNSSKFVQEGYVRLAVEVTSLSASTAASVRIIVEDSGPGIPLEKRDKIFMRFQESMDLMCQGTGLGLNLCKHLSSLLDAELSLDDSFDSGVPGYPGTRFVLDLCTPPVDKSERTVDTPDFLPYKDQTLTSVPTSLPSTLSVLFVEDDFMLRKLFGRTIRRVCPGWDLTEAANGEAALQIFQSDGTFDLIFVDQYMSSTNEQQLLGSETVREMRARGITSKICGLSANDVSDDFYAAGADAFVLKPFPCEQEAMSRELQSILSTPPYQRRESC